MILNQLWINSNGITSKLLIPLSICNDINSESTLKCISITTEYVCFIAFNMMYLPDMPSTTENF